MATARSTDAAATRGEIRATAAPHLNWRTLQRTKRGGTSGLFQFFPGGSRQSLFFVVLACAISGRLVRRDKPARRRE